VRGGEKKSSSSFKALMIPEGGGKLKDIFLNGSGGGGYQHSVKRLVFILNREKGSEERRNAVLNYSSANLEEKGGRRGVFICRLLKKNGSS